MRGFTLIELLIVVAIIGILAAIAIPNFLQAQTRAKVAEAMSEMRTLGTGLEVYRTDNPRYPMVYDAGGTFGFLKRLEVITRPVSYLKTIPEDPFSIAIKAADPYFVGYRYPYLTSGGDLPHPWTYDYSNIGHYADNGANWSITLSTFPGISPLTVRWGMHSAGPDATWNAFNQSTPLLIYDPSNGTTSNGDIWLMGPGQGFANR